MTSPIIPGSHQRVLEDWELIGIVADIVQETSDQRLGDTPSSNPDGPGDGHTSFIARQSRDEVLAVIDGLRQALKLRAVADEIRTHGQDNVDRQLMLTRCFE